MISYPCTILLEVALSIRSHSLSGCMLQCSPCVWATGWPHGSCILLFDLGIHFIAGSLPSFGQDLPLVPGSAVGPQPLQHCKVAASHRRTARGRVPVAAVDPRPLEHGEVPTHAARLQVSTFQPQPFAHTHCSKARCPPPAVDGNGCMMEAMASVNAAMTATAVGRRRWRWWMARTARCAFSWQDIRDIWHGGGWTAWHCFWVGEWTVFLLHFFNALTATYHRKLH
jgi:hypothetical protein